MTFSQEIREAANSIWEANFAHPFVQGIADGSLPVESFRNYIMQDAYYLSQFAKVQALGSAKANDLHTSNRMAKHVQGTYQAELGLHEKFSKMLGITDADRAAFEPAPTAYAYTSHLIRTAYTGQLGDIIAAILPCYWIYYEIGKRQRGAKPGVPVYEEWIAAYGGDWYAELVQEQIDGLDSIAATASPVERARMKTAFQISSRYELMFWDSALHQQPWPAS